MTVPAHRPLKKLPPTPPPPPLAGLPLADSDADSPPKTDGDSTVRLLDRTPPSMLLERVGVGTSVE